VQHEELIFQSTEMGIVTCVDANTGERVWRKRLGAVQCFTRYADIQVYPAGENGEKLVLRAARTSELVAKNKLDMGFIASPAIANGRMFIRGERHLVAGAEHCAAYVLTCGAGL
jgi:outer membrane protein assembly factor BamB